MFQQKLRVWTPEIQQAHNEQRMARGGDPGGAGKRGKRTQEMKQWEMNPIAGAVKRGADYASNLLDQGPSVRDVTSNLVGAIPFVGPDLRKAMEGSTTTVPVGLNMASNMPEEGYQYGEPAKYKKAGIETYKMPTTDLLDAMKVSDLVGTSGLSRAAESAGYGEVPDVMDLLDAAQVGGGLYGAAKLGSKGAKMAGKGALKALEQAGTAPRSGSMAAQRGVIKMPGGNFLTGRLEKNVAPLKTRTIAGETPAQRIPKHEELLKDPSLNQDQLDRVKYQLEETKKEAAIDKWVDSNLSNYIKKQLGTPDDPVRALAEQGITHKPSLLDEYPRNEEALLKQRKDAGFPEEGMAQSPLAKAWERASDESLASHRAGDIQGMPEKFAKRDEAERKMIAAREELDKKLLNHIKEAGLNDKEATNVVNGMTYSEKARLVGDQDFLQANTEYLAAHDPMMSSYIALGRENPWISKVAPETQLYSPFTGDLGFDHIIDVLKQDVAEGRIRPDQLNKVSMEQAVRRTYEYDQEMAKKMRETAIKQTEGMPVHKEYPEGYKWIELNVPEAKVPEGSTWEEYNGNHRLFGPNGESLSIGATKDEAIKLYNRLEREEKLRDALKYEGDTMGHCVGGYCPDVIAGRSRIYSLRDAKGEPHVTVEVKPVHRHSSEETDKLSNWFKSQPEALQDEITQEAIAAHDAAKQANTSKENRYYWGMAMNDAIRNRMGEVPPNIVQIKGKGNRAPKEEYLPFVQDFVKSGNWTDVGDFRNTGLIRKSDLIDKFSPDELDAVGSGEYLTKAEHDDLLLKALRPPEEGMKAGGEVHMSIGGDLMKAAKAAKTAKAVAEAKEKIQHPLIFPRAAAKTKEDIRPIAQRIAEQMTGDFVRQDPKVTTNPAGKSRKQWSREQEIPLETRSLIPESEVPAIDYETKLGHALVGVPGDPTLGSVVRKGTLESAAQPSVELTRVGDVVPEHPVPLYGGPRYGNDERFWASNLGQASPVQNRVNKLSEAHQAPVLGQYIKMAPDSANFAIHNLDSLLAIQQPERLPKSKLEELNKLIREGSKRYGKFPNFVGFQDPMDVLLSSQFDSKLRKHIAETLTKPTITNDLGLVNGLDVVAAITHPQLRDMETGISGFSIGEMRPGSNLRESLSEHPTYDTDIPGALIGQSKYPTPYEIAFPDTTAYTRKNLEPGVQEFNMLKMLGPRERIDQQYIDEMKMYEELMKEYTGKKKGGLAQAKKPKKVARHGNTVSN